MALQDPAGEGDVAEQATRPAGDVQDTQPAPGFDERSAEAASDATPNERTRPGADKGAARKARTNGARSAELRNLAGVRLTAQGRTFELDAGALELRVGELVVVEVRSGGSAVGVVSVPSALRAPRGPLPRVLRRAEPRDLERHRAHEQKIGSALAFARERSRARALPIKVFRVEAAPGADRMLFYFSSEQRIDFRELVRDLAARFSMRIELRQVGVRDEAKLVGGIGSCGRELCCTTFLPSFAPVSIKMAKNQNLVLNPSKVSGQCGRLKCCLVYEEAQYIEAGKRLPKLGKRVETPEGLGRVDDLNILAGKIRVAFPDKPPMTFTADEVRPAAPPPAPAQKPTRASAHAPSRAGERAEVQATAAASEDHEVDPEGEGAHTTAEPGVAME